MSVTRSSQRRAEKLFVRDVAFARSFNEYVAIMAVNSPRALVMDSWRRVELTLREYANGLTQTVTLRNSRAIEEALSQDLFLGAGFRLTALADSVCYETRLLMSRSLRSTRIRLDCGLGKARRARGYSAKMISAEESISDGFLGKLRDFRPRTALLSTASSKRFTTRTHKRFSRNSKDCQKEAEP